VRLGHVFLRATADVVGLGLRPQEQVVVLVGLVERGLQFLLDVDDGRGTERLRRMATAAALQV